MHLKKLSLINYKNFESKDFELDTKINCLVGNNGVGKTNVLDAIYHLSVGKSYFNPVATQNIRHGSDFFVIDGEFEKNDRSEKIICSLKKGNKKIIKRNAKAYDKLSDHIGFLPLVIISPADRDLIIEGSDTRRRFVDSVISQQNKDYLNNLITYNKVLQQRNALLKYFAANNTFNADNLEIYDQQLTELSKPIYNARKEFLEVFVPIFIERYKSISSGNEQVGLSYKSHLHDASLDELLKQHLNRDKALQFTSQGIHKDDLSFEIEEYPIKKFGSQGQQKSFLIALKLAQFDFIKEKAGVSPILLLDDIFDKLDEKRVSHIVSLLEDDHFGQLFISDTHAERTEKVVSKTHQSYKIFKL
ncbi:DNA replication/repair protein RecF [Spongiivirga citrea]|uniref:DNA replication and repair protein RecF n=1 Tax=Spongiivirga citrea TaxID=1481457 RepID=A0A6M0CKR5_9FLAO|nr:DNA replication and repair protein RecF [Spongiivirga citrea]NER18545.1 DNA replication and repair protein RecF [Spongiivirga citrea]